MGLVFSLSMVCVTYGTMILLNLEDLGNEVQEEVFAKWVLGASRMTYVFFTISILLLFQACIHMGHTQLGQFAYISKAMGWFGFSCVFLVAWTMPFLSHRARMGEEFIEVEETFNYTRRLRRLRTTSVQGAFIAGSVFCGLLFFNPTAEEGTHLKWIKTFYTVTSCGTFVGGALSALISILISIWMADMRQPKQRARFSAIVWMLDGASFYLFTGAQFGWMLAVSAIFAVNMIEYSYVSLGLGSVGVMIMVAGWVYAKRTFMRVQQESAGALQNMEMKDMQVK